jgi:parallel beta-helix repeat protein
MPLDRQPSNPSSITRDVVERARTDGVGSRRRLAGVFGLVLSMAAVPSLAADFYVDGANPSCSDSGPGSSAVPYCTISQAASARAGPGVTIFVRPAVYREEVTVPTSGTAGSPLVFRATGPSVILDGADSFSSPGSWTLYSGNVWRASGVTWSPLQVMVDGVRCTLSTASPSSIPLQSFAYVQGSGLYLNAGVGNPGNHQTFVGRRSHGFLVSGRSWVTIDGFTVLRTDDSGIHLSSPSSNVEIVNNTVTFANNFGIRVVGGSELLIGSNRVSFSNDHGIYLSGGVTGSSIRDNESFENARPNVRAANGIQIHGSPGNRIERNLLHHNQDTGLQINTGANDNISIQNRTWSNGDHGIDHLYSTGNIHIGEVVWGNFKDGVSIEGDSPGTSLHDCILVDNGLTTARFNLQVDSGSSSGFVSDYNIIDNTASANGIRFGTTVYTTLSSYAAGAGQDAHSIEADARFVNPATGDFHLQPGSPAIDSGTSAVANWPSTDAEGRGRIDDPQTPNSGAGPVPFADRGALEFGLADPTAALVVTPSSGSPPLTVTANASGSSGGSSPIVSYQFNFSDGTVIGPQPGPTATHTYALGNWSPSVTITTASGATASTSTPVLVVTLGSELCTNTSFESNRNGWAQFGNASINRVTGGYAGSWALQIQGPNQISEFGVDDAPNWVGSVSSAGTRYRYSAWVRSASGRGAVRLRVREYLAGVLKGQSSSTPVTLSSTWQQLVVEHSAQSAGSTLDFQVLDMPVVTRETFRTDVVSIRTVVSGTVDVPAPGAPLVLEFGARPAPNPIQGRGYLDFTTTRPGPVRIQVFDAAGRLIAQPMDAPYVPSGQHHVRILDRGIADHAVGVYFYRLQAVEGVLRGRFALVR